MTKKELVNLLAPMPDDAEVHFDTEAARFNVHLVTIDTCFYEEELGGVVLNTKDPRQH